MSAQVASTDKGQKKHHYTPQQIAAWKASHGGGSTSGNKGVTQVQPSIQPGGTIATA